MIIKGLVFLGVLLAIQTASIAVHFLITKDGADNDR